MSVLTCPVCRGAMKETTKNGVSIDICTQCRGVWLDRGELEKLMEGLRPERHHHHDHDDHDHDHDHDNDDGPFRQRQDAQRDRNDRGQRRKQSPLDSFMEMFE